jgi:putative peptidoglycan lipid II flippase
MLALAGAVIASSSPSAVSWLYFAGRLVELPLGIVGVAMGTVQVAELSRAVRSGDSSAVAEAESRGLELAVGLALPATLGLIVLSEPIVRLLFEHGAFTDADSVATARVLMVLSLALPANVLVKALSPAFFAREDTGAPLRATVQGVLVAIVTALLLGHVFGATGVAAGIACGAWSNAASLVRRGMAAFGFSIDAAARRRLPRIVVAALAMGALLWFVGRAMSPSAHGLAQAATLAGEIALALMAYGLLLALLGVTSWSVVRAVWQTRSRDLRAQGQRGKRRPETREE